MTVEVSGFGKCIQSDDLQLGDAFLIIRQAQVWIAMRVSEGGGGHYDLLLSQLKGEPFGDGEYPRLLEPRRLSRFTTHSLGLNSVSRGP